jgi:WD40 repeat protein
MGFFLVRYNRAVNCSRDYFEVWQFANFYVDAENSDSVLTITGPQGRINRVLWGPLNKTLISAGEDATIRIWDAEVCPNFWTSFKSSLHSCCWWSTLVPMGFTGLTWWRGWSGRSGPLFQGYPSSPVLQPTFYLDQVGIFDDP